MKKTALILCGLLLAGQAAFANSLGAGYGATSEIYKSNETEHFLPIVDVEYNNFFMKGATVNGFSIGYNLYKDDFYAFSLYVKPFGGYKMDGNDMDYGYRSIDDREHKFMGGAEVKMYTGIYDIEMSASVDYGKEGGNVLFSMNRPYAVNSRLVLIPSVNFVYYNSDYIDYYFGVDHHEALGKLSGKEYEGDSAYTFGANLTGSFRLTDSFSLLGFMGVNRLSDEIKNSPIVDNDILYYAGTAIVYTF